MSEQIAENDEHQLQIPGSVEQEQSFFNTTADGGSGATDLKTVESASQPGSMTKNHPLLNGTRDSTSIRKSQCQPQRSKKRNP